MKAFDKFVEFLKFEDDGDDEYEYAPLFREPPTTAPVMKQEEPKSQEPIGFPAAKPKVNNAPRTSNQPPRKGGNVNMQEVCRVSPTNVLDGRTITDYLLQNKIVFLDLEGIDGGLAQRIIDFVSGATYAIDGTLQKVSNLTFVIAPSTVNISGDFNETFDDSSNVVF